MVREVSWYVIAFCLVVSPLPMCSPRYFALYVGPLPLRLLYHAPTFTAFDEPYDINTCHDSGCSLHKHLVGRWQQPLPCTAFALYSPACV